ncbi:MAG: tRNA (N6-threonylcarbamoyladenosine(37)-N6)-methyltransferase TrmO [Kofleriaceae bacterium]|nr:MAG: tRNA (N6-threonylcarbamoyladenosine(37)-N6)-methyltransferase TrmO [Kofleriaceae bacterium]MBZ0237688.1 tRNA (N6-threonylcarbamoyladenosine(37)-N6)-methyltransferase TrmO [Kofleriaceae bacterium]
MDLTLTPIGAVESALADLDAAPRQGDEGAPEAWLVIDPRFAAALDGLAPGDDLLVFTWLDRARRDLLRVHPRGDTTRPEAGVFATRSPHRPNPIGLHRVELVAVSGAPTSGDAVRLLVRPLEAVHGTPVLDLKPVLRDER